MTKLASLLHLNFKKETPMPTINVVSLGATVLTDLVSLLASYKSTGSIPYTTLVTDVLGIIESSLHSDPSASASTSVPSTPAGT